MIPTIDRNRFDDRNANDDRNDNYDPEAHDAHGTNDDTRVSRRGIFPGLHRLHQILSVHQRSAVQPGKSRNIDDTLEMMTGIYFVQNCRDGTIFDTETEVCDFPYKVKADTCSQ